MGNLKKILDKSTHYVIIQRLSVESILYGGIAQLGERLNGIQEVSGSIPLISTNEALKVFDFQGFSFTPATFGYGCNFFDQNLDQNHVSSNISIVSFLFFLPSGRIFLYLFVPERPPFTGRM